MNNVQLVWILIGIAGVVGALLKFHFSEMKKMENKIHELELKLKELEKTDALQQQALDQLPQLYPLLNKAFDAMRKVAVR